jgi:hypothetical protein
MDKEVIEYIKELAVDHYGCESLDYIPESKRKELEELVLRYASVDDISDIASANEKRLHLLVRGDTENFIVIRRSMSRELYEDKKPYLEELFLDFVANRDDVLNDDEYEMSRYLGFQGSVPMATMRV